MDKLLLLLNKLYGKKFIQRMIGTRTNVSRIKVRNDVTKRVFKREEILLEKEKNMAALDSAIKEAGPYLPTMNDAQKLIYRQNVELLADLKGIKIPAKAAQTGKIGDVIDIASGAKVKGGILDVLTKEAGIPKGIDPDSTAGQAIMDVNRLTAKAKKLSEDASKSRSKLEDIFQDSAKFSQRMQPGGSMYKEGNVRTALREFLQTETKAGKLKVSDDDLHWINTYSGMGGEQDPITIFRRYYGEGALENVDSIAHVFEKGESFKHYEELLRKNVDKKWLTPQKGGPKKGYLSQEEALYMDKASLQTEQMKETLKAQLRKQKDFSKTSLSDSDLDFVLQDVYVGMNPEEGLSMVMKRAKQIDTEKRAAEMKKARGLAEEEGVDPLETILPGNVAEKTTKAKDSLSMRLIKNYDQELTVDGLMAEGYSKEHANILIKARKKMISGEEANPNEALLRVKEEYADAKGVDVDEIDIDFQIDDPEPTDFAKGGLAGVLGV